MYIESCHMCAESSHKSIEWSHMSIESCHMCMESCPMYIQSCHMCMGSSHKCMGSCHMRIVTCMSTYGNTHVTWPHTHVTWPHTHVTWLHMWHDPIHMWHVCLRMERVHIKSSFIDFSQTGIHFSSIFHSTFLHRLSRLEFLMQQFVMMGIPRIFNATVCYDGYPKNPGNAWHESLSSFIRSACIFIEDWSLKRISALCNPTVGIPRMRGLLDPILCTSVTRLPCIRNSVSHYTAMTFSLSQVFLSTRTPSSVT